ncbi:MAG TPA: RNA 2'-phosphotransferase [Planctomycetaceae bacterium]|nr:RNA 2'-phosphotransferase [Planctomycetaceae bacterium]
MNRRLTRISKYLTFILRHQPESIGLQLDADRWARVDELVRSANASGKSLTEAQVRDVVAQNELQIFALSEDGSRIRAQ